MRSLSKSKLLAYRQCPKRLWLEVHHPELLQDTPSTQIRFAAGHQTGEIARQLYDPDGMGSLIDPHTEGFDQAFVRTQKLLQSAQPIFEAGFRTESAMAFADVMLPIKDKKKIGWQMIEVKSSTTVKDYHRDDIAVQAYIARSCGVELTKITLTHIDNSWVYPGKNNYNGLLIENDLTDDAISRENDVREWIDDAQQIATKKRAPKITTGKHCNNPYECGFLAYCQAQEPQAEQPINWLPDRLNKALQAHITENNITELRDVPDELLSKKQQRVKAVTVSGKPHFNKQGAANALGAHKLPAYFLDFETIALAIPIWKGTRPYQQIPFQFSLHCLSRKKKLEQSGFLDLSGKDPSKVFAETLITACGEQGPIFVYNAGFETARIRELSERFPRLAKPLLALNARVVDLLPVAREHYYHPSQQGSWSIKAVLPALCPDLNYSDLDGVQNGGMAMDAFLEALAPQTSKTRKAEIEQQLLAYCALDTYAMVRMWCVFTGETLKV